MMIFAIIMYVAFGLLCVYFVLSGIKKVKEIKGEQESQANLKELKNKKEVPSTEVSQ